ncbi:MAG: hypothetical protein LHW44_01445 [Candidatus Cloacimonetes bacterium]|nr:hypothetical protein [Candidatus Cloacimonadota bacterium]
MIKKNFYKYYKTSPAMKKMNTLRKRIRAAYRVLIDNKKEISRFESRFEILKEKYELTPDELSIAYKYGILPGSFIVYNFDKWNIGQYLSDRDLYKLNFKERGIAPFLVDKRNLPLLFQKNAHYLPSLSMAIDKSKVQYIIDDGVYQEGDFDLADSLQRYLGKYAKLIVKPNDASHGKRIFTISQITEDMTQRIRNEGNAIINNVLINEEYAHRINPSTLNTIRVNFFKTQDGSLRVFSMLHRFGTSSETCVDNLTGGGMAAGIDQETGEFMQAYTIQRKKINLDVHPATGEKITGYIIPDWKTKKKQIDDLLQEINYLDYGGLDVAFTTEGIKIVEVNTRFPSLRSMQFASPALIDVEFVEFLKVRGFDKLKKPDAYRGV